MPPTPLLALENPFVGVLHPQAEELRVYGRTWAQRVGLVNTPAELERFDAALYWQLVAEAYPTVPWEILTIAHDWSCWGFFMDDFDDASEAATQPGALRHFFAQVLAILRDAPLPGELPPLLHVVADVWKRMHQHSSSEWRRRFHDTLADSFAAYQWEAQNRVARHIPPVAEYVDYRRKTGGWRTLVLLVDLAEGRTVPGHVFGNPTLQHLLDTANNIICWANDLLSYEKERAIGDVHNLVRVVQSEYRLTEEAAVGLVVKWHNQAVHLWKHLVQHVPRWESEYAQHIQAYLAFSEHYIYSNCIWSQVSGRYQSRVA